MDSKSRREPIEWIVGKHEAIISVELYMRNRTIRTQKGTSPGRASKPVHQPLLGSLAKCWECLEHDGTESNLRSVPGRPGKRFSQCARIQNRYPSKRPVEKEIGKTLYENNISVADMQAIQLPVTDTLIARHKSTIAEHLLEAQVDHIVSDFIIPDAWYEIVQAYFLSEHGISDFERCFHNARREAELVKDLYEKCIIDAAEFDQRNTMIDRYIANLRPSSQPGSGKVLPYLQNFKATWQMLELLEKRALLQNMFIGIYFDSDGCIRKIQARSPFDDLLDFSGVLI